METDRVLYVVTVFVKLRENHSGMETYTVYVYGVLLFVCCVRTIVVWKLETVSTQTLEVYVA